MYSCKSITSVHNLTNLFIVDYDIMTFKLLSLIKMHSIVKIIGVNVYTYSATTTIKVSMVLLL